MSTPKTLAEKLAAYPELEKSVSERIVGVEAESGYLDRADEAEEAVIENLQEPGKRPSYALSASKDVVINDIVFFMGEPDEAGDQWSGCTIEQGLKRQSWIHYVSDGAKWIASQADRVFASQGHFLVDYYHLWEYMAEAARECVGNDEKACHKWVDEQKARMKTGCSRMFWQSLSHTETASMARRLISRRSAIAT